MTEAVLEAPEPQTPETFTWWQAWWYSIARPTVEMYEKLVNDPKANKSRSFLWISIGFLGSFVVGILSLSAFTVIFLYMMGNNQGSVILREMMLRAALLILPSLGVTIVFFLLYIGACHLLAKMMGGSGSYWKLVYAQAVYQTPFLFVTFIVGFVPIVNMLSFLLTFYAAYLDVVGVKAVYRISWGRAAAAGLIPYAAVMILAVIVIVVVIASRGILPFNDYFKNTVQGMISLFIRA